MSNSVERIQSIVGDRYRVDREIGAGGMATVYLAEDVKHGRRVAVKVLDAQVAAEVSAERFLREIRLVAGIQHPHVLPLHDSGEVTPDGASVIYIANTGAPENDNLFRAPSDGSAPEIQLNPPPTPDGDVHSFRITPDSARVVYRGRENAGFELFSVPSDGSGTAVKLNGTLAFAGAVAEYAIAPGGAAIKLSRRWSGG